MQHTDFLCDTCGESCGEGCTINGKKLPLVAYMVVGIPPGAKLLDQNSPGTLDLNAPGIFVPQIVRELMAQPVARREWCMKCLAKAFKLPLVDAKGKQLKTPKS